MSPVLRMNQVTRRYRTPAGPYHVAVDGVSLQVDPGEVVGLTGETGAGKSTLARLAAGMELPDSGTVSWGPDAREVPRCRRVQMIFQDPVAALNPHLRIGEAIMEPLVVAGIALGADAVERVREVARQVGLPEDTLERLPETLSGGELQRACLARALVARPRLLVADEPVSALDAPVRRDILARMKRLVRSEGVGLLLISHDVDAGCALADRMLVMLSGVIVEEAPGHRLMAGPVHPYTRALTGRGGDDLAADSDVSVGRRGTGNGCPFVPECRWKRQACENGKPGWRTVAPGHRVRCDGPGLEAVNPSATITP